MSVKELYITPTNKTSGGANDTFEFMIDQVPGRRLIPEKTSFTFDQSFSGATGSVIWGYSHIFSVEWRNTSSQLEYIQPYNKLCEDMEKIFYGSKATARENVYASPAAATATKNVRVPLYSMFGELGAGSMPRLDGKDTLRLRVKMNSSLTGSCNGIENLKLKIVVIDNPTFISDKLPQSVVCQSDLLNATTNTQNVQLTSFNKEALQGLIFRVQESGAVSGVGASSAVSNYQVKVNDIQFEQLTGLGDYISGVEKVVSSQPDITDSEPSICGQYTGEVNTTLQNNISVKLQLAAAGTSPELLSVALYPVKLDMVEGSLKVMS